jgi:hypothetical protein
VLHLHNFSLMYITISSGTKNALQGLPVPHKRKQIYTKIMEVIYGKICREQNTLDSYLEIPHNYWLECGVNRPSTYLKQLEQFGIIEIDHHFYFNEYASKSKGYRIEQELAFSSPMLLKFHNRAINKHDRKDPFTAPTIKNLKKLKTTFKTVEQMEVIAMNDINYQYLVKSGLLVCKVPTGKHELYLYNDERKQYQKYKATLSKAAYPISREHILQIAIEKELKTIFWKNKVYLVSNAEKWIQNKIIEIQHHYLSDLMKFRFIQNGKNIICGRNLINQRLDTNMTSSASMSHQYLRNRNGESLESFDVSNSQLTFFGGATYHMERFFNFFELEKMFIDEKTPFFNSALFINRLTSNYSINIILDSLNHIESLRNLELIKNNKKRNKKYLKVNGRGIIQYKSSSSPMIARGTACQKHLLFNELANFLNKNEGNIFRGLGEFRKLAASGRIYEYFASLLYESRYKNVFSNCATFEELQLKIKYAESIKNENCNTIGSLVKLKPNLSTFGKPKEHYQREFKAIRNDVKRLTFQTIFPHYSQSNDLKKILKEKHPSVIEFIDRFKKFFASPNFSNFLSRVESSVFIDGIYWECIERGLTVYPKHDGILFFPSERKRVLGVIMKHMNAFFGKGNYKYEMENIVEKYK